MGLMPSFSVIIPTYNRAGLVVKALESVLAQTYAAHDVIVVDDGSTDETARDIKRYLSERPEHAVHVDYIYQPNQGKSVALNQGILRTTGDWFAFLDSDDCWMPDKLETQVRAIQEYGDESRACFTDARYVNNPQLAMTVFERAGMRPTEDIGKLADTVKHLLKPPAGIYVQTLIVPRDLVDKIGGFDPKLRIGEDTDFLFRLALETAFCYVNRPLVQIDRTPNRAVGVIEHISDDEKSHLRQLQYMYETWLNLIGDSRNEEKKIILMRLEEVQNGWADCSLDERDYKAARRALAEAIRIRFTAKTAVKWILSHVLPGFTRKLVIRQDSLRKKRQIPA
jgi:glycosyltransferase involved in cell wall biosynthesis